MISSEDVERACFQFTRRSDVRVTPQLVDLITSILNGLISDAEPRGEHVRREVDVLHFLEGNLSAVLGHIRNDASQFRDQPIVLIDVINFLSWLIPAQRRSQLRAIIGGPLWMFDCK